MVWTLDMSKIFSTKSTHYCLNQRGHSQSGRLIWKSKLPLEINIFLYQAFRNKLQCATSMRKSDPQLLHIQYTLNFLSHIFFSVACQFYGIAFERPMDGIDSQHQHMTFSQTGCQGGLEFFKECVSSFLHV